VNFEKGEILADFTILKKEIEYQVNKDGTFTRTEKEICRVNTETGINLVGQRSFRYSPQIDTIDIKWNYHPTEQRKCRRAHVR